MALPIQTYLGPNAISKSYEFDQYENISSIITGGWRQSFNFDGASGNLTSRTYLNCDTTFMRTENFQYDTKDRLTTSQVTGLGSKTVTYDDTGNILMKTDAGWYYYSASKVNALETVTLFRSAISTNLQTVAYNSHNKVTELSEEDYTYDVLYGADGGRIRSRLYEDSILSKTKYYIPGYEKIITPEDTVENHYISSPYGLEAIIVKDGPVETTYLAETDHLGSLIGLTDTAGVYAERYSYDAWGRRRNPTNWSIGAVPAATITDRGFTGHEHLDEFHLINMGGRLFDPLTSRFLNSDPVIDSRGTAQGLNSYTYCLKNPLKYTDPTGYSKAPLSEVIIFQNPDWIRHAGGGHYSSSWFENQMRTGHEAAATAEDRRTSGKPGENGNGTGLGGIYYDHVTGTYRDAKTYEAVSQEEALAVIEYYDVQLKRLYFSGSIDNPYEVFTGYSLTDGTRIDFEFDEATTGEDDFVNYANAIRTVNGTLGIVVSTFQGIIQNTKIGADIAYAISGNSNIISGVTSVFKYSPYFGLLVTVGTGSYLSSQVNPETNRPYQPWGETGTDMAANIGVIYLGTQLGGFYGAAAAAFYMADKAVFKAYINSIMEHPDWVLPSWVHSFAH